MAGETNPTDGQGKRKLSRLGLLKTETSQDSKVLSEQGARINSSFVWILGRSWEIARLAHDFEGGRQKVVPDTRGAGVGLLVSPLPPTPHPPTPAATCFCPVHICCSVTPCCLKYFTHSPPTAEEFLQTMAVCVADGLQVSASFVSFRHAFWKEPWSETAFRALIYS